MKTKAHDQLKREQTLGNQLYYQEKHLKLSNFFEKKSQPHIFKVKMIVVD